MERATCWSITINNPKVEEYSIPLPPSWSLDGQLERGSEGTEHYQGMLKTPQVRFSAVKKLFPRAHIEVARNPNALKKYVHKEETRVAEVDRIPTLFEYQTIIASKWVENEFQERLKRAIQANQVPDFDEIAMRYIDSLVAADIESGRCGAEFIAINPMWRCSWKKFWRSIIKRNGASLSQEGCSQVSRPQEAVRSPRLFGETPDGDAGISPRRPSIQGDLYVDELELCSR